MSEPKFNTKMSQNGYFFYNLSILFSFCRVQGGCKKTGTDLYTVISKLGIDSPLTQKRTTNL